MSGLARTLAVTLTGLQGHLVQVEAHASQGLPGFTLVGLPDAAVRESRERVRAALSTCGTAWGERRVTANLSPADLPKTGTGFDLSLALAVLGARQELSLQAIEAMAGTVFIGELGLDASVRPVRGVLPAVSCAAAAGVRRIVVPQDCLAEARLVPGIEVWPATPARATPPPPRPHRLLPLRTWPTSSGSMRRVMPWRWLRPGAITSCSSGRPAPARR